MTEPDPTPSPRTPLPAWAHVGTVAYALSALALWMVLQAKPVAALLSGLLLYSLVDVLAPKLTRLHQKHDALAVAILSTLLLALGLAGWALARFIGGEGRTLDGLLDHVADIIDRSRGQLPPGSAMPCRAAWKSWPTR